MMFWMRGRKAPRGSDLRKDRSGACKMLLSAVESLQMRFLLYTKLKPKLGLRVTLLPMHARA